MSDGIANTMWSLFPSIERGGYTAICVYKRFSKRRDTCQFKKYDYSNYSKMYARK
jgi:hypothetical protein